MPPVSSARRVARPPVGGLGAAALRVRWDRVGRVALLALLAAVVALYVGPALSLLSTWRRSNAEQAQLRALERQHVTLLRQAASLRSPITLATEARRLGMLLPGERPYVVRNLPGD
jgi:hypothetical protein